MKTFPSTVLTTMLLCLLGFTNAGCNRDATDDAPSFSLNEPEEDHEDGHGHGEDDHDHPAHGKRGGHMVKLSNDSETEVYFDEESDLLTVYIDGLNDVSKITMTTTISGEDNVYALERTDTPVGTVFGLQSEELGTAIKMGNDVVKTLLTITTADGDLTADYEHHSH